MMWIAKSGQKMLVDPGTLPYWESLGWQVDADANAVGDLTQQSAAYPSLGTVAATAVLYVSTDGDDVNNDGRSWGKAFATINAAIAALGANGGVIEVGYGDFAPFTISSTTGTKFGIHVRGRGIGKTLSYTDATTTTGKHPTRIVNSGGAGTNAVTIVGATDTEDHWPGGIILENLAVAGNSTSQDGINISAAPYVQLRRVVSEGHGRYGLYVIGGWIYDLDTVRCVNNGTVGASLSGGAFFDSPVNHINIRGTSYFSGNYGYGLKLNASVTNCFGTLFERNKANAAEQGNGVRLIIGPGMLNLFGCWFESNGTAYQIRNEVANARVLAQGCYFEGNGAVQYAMRAFSTAYIFVRNSRFSGHTVQSVEYSSGGLLDSAGNYSADPKFTVLNSRNIAATDAAVPLRYGMSREEHNTVLALPSVTAPASNIAGTGQLYVDGADGALKFRSAAGTVTTIGPA